jgi:hypothetical protein
LCGLGLDRSFAEGWSALLAFADEFGGQPDVLEKVGQSIGAAENAGGAGEQVRGAALDSAGKAGCVGLGAVDEVNVAYAGRAGRAGGGEEGAEGEDQDEGALGLVHGEFPQNKRGPEFGLEWVGWG